MWLIAIAALWWVANTVTSIVSKIVMTGEDAIAPKVLQAGRLHSKI